MSESKKRQVAAVGRGDVPDRALVITVSTRAAAGIYEDTSGPYVAQFLAGLGFLVPEPVVVPDGEDVESALRHAIGDSVELVVTSGGTGISPSDATPELTMALLDTMIPGIPEAIRAAGVAAGKPSAMLGRGVAGVAGKTIVVNLPGSLGAVREAMTVVGPALKHAVDQLRGKDHRRNDDS